MPKIVNVNLMNKITNQIISRVKAKYPGITITNNDRDKIFNYMEGQTRDIADLIKASDISTTTDQNLLNAYNDRFLNLNYGGSIVKVDLQTEIFSILRSELIETIIQSERTIVGNKMFYDILENNGNVNSKKDPLDFSKLYNCAHLFGLPLKNDFDLFYSKISSHCIANGISLAVNFPTTSTISNNLSLLKIDVENYFNNVVPNIASLKDLGKQATVLTDKINAFYKAYQSQLTIDEAKELVDLTNLVSYNLKNMEHLYYNDMENILEYLKSADFAFQVYKLFDRDDIFMDNNGTLVNVNISNYIGDNQKLFEDIHLFTDKDGNSLFPLLKKKPINPNIITELATFSPNDIVEEAEKSFDNETLAENVLYYYSENNQSKKDALLNIIQQLCNQLKYVPNKSIDPLLKQIDEIISDHKSYEESIINYYLNDLSNFLNNRKNETNTNQYNSENFYIEKRFKIDLLRVVKQYYTGDLSNFNINIFYQQHSQEFPYYLQSTKLPKLKKFDEMFENFPFKNECQTILNANNAGIISTNMTSLLDKLQRYFNRNNNSLLDNNELNIEDYIFYSELKKRIDDKLASLLGSSSNIYNAHFNTIDAYFNSGYSLLSCSNILDNRRIELDTLINMHNIQNGIDYDPLLVFKYLCEQNNGQIIESFFTSQTDYVINMAKMVNKLPLFKTLTGISNASIEFNIGDELDQVNTIFLTRSSVKLLLYKDSKLVRSLQSTTDSTKKGTIVYFKNESALRALKSLGITGYGLPNRELLIPEFYERAAKVS